jgi:hypothetical protein
MPESKKRKKEQKVYPKVMVVKVDLSSLPEEVDIQKTTVTLTYDSRTKHSVLLFKHGESHTLHAVGRNTDISFKYEVTHFVFEGRKVAVFLHNKERYGRFSK